jgi:hypothetical protein
MQPKLIDDDNGTLRVMWSDDCLKSWHYSDKTRREKYAAARGFIDGWAECLSRNTMEEAR